MLKNDPLPLAVHALVADMLRHGELNVWMFWRRAVEGVNEGYEQSEELFLTAEAACRAAIEWINDRRYGADIHARAPDPVTTAIGEWFANNDPIFKGGVIPIGVDLSLS